MSEQSNNLTRRQILQMFGAAGTFASPLIGPLATAAETGTDTRMVAAVIFEPHIPTALRRALQYAGDDGFVASMPQLLHARSNAAYDNIIWNTWFTSNTEESVVTTPQGKHVIVAIHGGGIFVSPDRFERSFYADLNRHNSEGVTGQFAARITEREARDVLEGKLPDGTEIPVYSFDEFKRGIANLPMRYGVILDFEAARNSTRGYDPFDVLKDEPNMIVRAGGVEPLAVYSIRISRRPAYRSWPATRAAWAATSTKKVAGDMTRSMAWVVTPAWSGWPAMSLSHREMSQRVCNTWISSCS